MNYKTTLSIIVSFVLGMLVIFLYQQLRIDKIEQVNKANIYSSQQLFDIDQQMILIDVNSYQALQHCYDKPKNCNIFDPNGQVDQTEKKSMQLVKEKQTLINKNPFLIPEHYRAAWGIK